MKGPYLFYAITSSGWAAALIWLSLQPQIATWSRPIIASCGGILAILAVGWMLRYEARP